MRKPFLLLLALCLYTHALSAIENTDSSGFKFNSFATLDIGGGTGLIGLTYGQYLLNEKKVKTSLSFGAMVMPSEYQVYTLNFKGLLSFGNHHIVGGVIFRQLNLVHRYVDYSYSGESSLLLDLGYRYQKPSSRMFYGIDFTPTIYNWDSQIFFPWACISVGYNFNSFRSLQTKFRSNDKSKLWAEFNSGAGVSHWNSNYLTSKSSSYFFFYELEQINNPTFSTPIISNEISVYYKPDHLYFWTYFNFSQYFIKNYFDVTLFSSNPSMYSYGVGFGYPFQLPSNLTFNIKTSIGRFHLNDDFQLRPYTKEYTTAPFRKYNYNVYAPFEYSLGFNAEKQLSSRISILVGAMWKYKTFRTYLPIDYASDPEIGIIISNFEHEKFNINDYLFNVGLKFNIY